MLSPSEGERTLAFCPTGVSGCVLQEGRRFLAKTWLTPDLCQGDFSLTEICPARPEGRAATLEPEESPSVNHASSSFLWKSDFLKSVCVGLGDVGLF